MRTGIALLAALGLLAPEASAGEFEVVVETVDAIPGPETGFYCSGNYLCWGGAPRLSLNRHGDISFATNIGGNPDTEAGVFARIDGQLQLLAREGDTLPNGDELSGYDRYYTFEAATSINSSHQLAFISQLNSSNGAGLFVWQPDGTIERRLEDGDVAPGTGVLFDTTNGSSVAMNDAAEVAFWWHYSLGIPDPYGTGIFVSHPTQGIRALALKDGTTPIGGQYGEFGASPDINENGVVSFRAEVQGQGWGVFIDDGGVDLPIATFGSSAPGGGTFAGAVSTSDATSINLHRQVAFREKIAGGPGSQGIFVGQYGEPTRSVALLSEPAPGNPGHVFYGLGNPSLDDAGDVLFQATITPDGGATQRTALFLERNLVLECLYSEAFPMPGQTTLFTSVLGLVAHNNAGDILVHGRAGGSIHGLYLQAADRSVPSIGPSGRVVVAIALAGVGAWHSGRRRPRSTRREALRT